MRSQGGSSKAKGQHQQVEANNHQIVDSAIPIPLSFS